MARPKKEKQLAPAEDKVMQLQYSQFMTMQNSIAHALTIYRQMATNAMQATSQQLGAINAAMLQVQQATKKHMTDNNIDPETTDITSYAPLNVVLHLDKNLIGNPLGDPLAVELQPAAVVAAPKSPEAKAKKERKPRKPKDPNAPKRPLTGYLMYYTESKDDIEKRLKSELGSDVSKGRVQEEGKNIWNNMAEKEKDVWKEKYKAEWEKYQEAVAAYLAKGGALDPESLTNPEEMNPVEQLNALEEVEAAASDSDDESSEDEIPEKIPTPPPAKKAAKGKKATPAAAAKESEKKKKDAAKEATPKKPATKKDAAESLKKAAAAKADTPDTAKKGKKRKSTAGGDDDAAEKSDKKKKR